MTRLATVVAVLLLFLVSLSSSATSTRDLTGGVLRLPSETSRFFRPGDDQQEDGTVGTRWAVLIAGSNGYWNYRHQVIICLINFDFVLTIEV